MACLLILIILLTCCSTIAFAQENSTLQPSCVKATNYPNTCNPQFPKSKLKKVLRLQGETINNIVRIRISVISKNKTQHFPELTWASEIGRTIISLVSLTEKWKIYDSPTFTWILKVGTEEIDIKLNASDGCLLPGSNETNKMFDILLLALFSHAGDTHSYKLCRRQDDGPTPFSCCQIIGDENLKICDNYSSVVVELAFPAAIVVFCISSLFVLPFVLEYVVRYPSNDEPRFYKTSESHMSLTSVFSMIFFEGRGPVKSFFRRSVLAGLSLLVFLPTGFLGSYFLLVTFWTWFAVFLVTYDVRMTNDKCKETCNESCKSKNEEGCLWTQWGKDIVSCFTIPFFLVFFHWKKRFQKRCQNYELFRSLSNEDLGGFKIFCCRLFQFIYGLGGCIFIAFSAACYLLFVLFGLIKFTMADLIVSFVLPHPFHCSPCSCNSVDSGLFCFIKTCETVPQNIWFIVVRLATLANVGFLIGMILMFALFMVVGLSLNAEYFNPFLASTLALILFFWKNWKFSVEGRCLQLKTSIIEICKEKAPSTEDEQTVNGGPRSELDNSSLFCDLYFGRRNGCDCYGQAAGRVPARGPTIRTIEPTTATSLRVTWEQLINNDLNEKVRKYKIYYNIGSKVTYCSTNKTVTGADPTTTDLSGLKPATEYTVAVRAFNHLGGGPLGDPKSGTTADDTNNAEGNEPMNSETKQNEEPNIKFDEHGEAMIAKTLYDDISKEVLPLDHLLVFFFRRVIFVSVYAFALCIAMILARDSGVSEGIQAVSAIAGALIPLFLDSILADHHAVKMDANNMAMKEKLLHMLKAERLGKNILVKLIKINHNSNPNSNPSPERGSENEQEMPPTV